jgi:hypothetical protein
LLPWFLSLHCLNSSSELLSALPWEYYTNQDSQMSITSRTPPTQLGTHFQHSPDSLDGILESRKDLRGSIMLCHPSAFPLRCFVKLKSLELQETRSIPKVYRIHQHLSTPLLQPQFSPSSFILIPSQFPVQLLTPLNTHTISSCQKLEWDGYL